MINKNWIYNDEYIIVLPYNNKYNNNAFQYTFGNVLLLDNTKGSIDYVNDIKKNNFKQIIFVDYVYEYKEMIMSLKNDHIIKAIYTKDLGALTNENYNSMFSEIMNLYNKGHINKVGFLDSNLFEVYKNKIDCCHISLDIEKKETLDNYDKHRIGILSDANNNMHSFYNSLCSLKFNNYIAGIDKANKNIKDISSLFGIKYEERKNKKNEENLLNLYINFTDNDNTIFLESMDRYVPCIIGNNDLLKNSKLEELLVVKSDDNIDEISNKIEEVIKNRSTILKIYKDFRKEYIKKCKKELCDFLEVEEKKSKKEESENNILLSIVVPVYNTEKYLKKCIESIIRALPKKIIEKVEILIINDGSKDNSEAIIKEYKEKYKKLIRYIEQDNHGLGNVRNVGLKEARGKYISSIDSDDTINKLFYSCCLDDLLNDVDIVIYDWMTITDTTKYETAALDYIFKKGNIYEGLLYTSIMPSTCNKIYKKELIMELNLKYVEDKYEDLSVTPLVMLKAHTIRYINKPYYEYYIRSNSIMRSSSGLSMINIIKELNDRIEKNKSIVYCNLDKLYFYTYSWRIEEYIINPMYMMDKKELSNYIDYIYKNIYEIIMDIFNNNYYKEMIKSLSINKQKYIIERNKAFKDKKIESFMNNRTVTIKITPVIVYYGEQNNN